MPEQPPFDADRPLRDQPVSRDEVHIDRIHNRLLAMPLATFQLVLPPSGDPEDADLVGDPALWQPLLDELTAEQARLAAGYDAPDRALLPTPRLPEARVWVRSAFEWDCAYCGKRFLATFRPKVKLYFCSNRCERLWRNAVYRDWRHNNPPDYARVNKARTEKRAAARAERVCGHCGKPLDAARSTKRFCSDICRVRASRALATQDISATVVKPGA